MAKPISDAFDVTEIAERLRADNGGYEVFHASPGIDLGVYVSSLPNPTPNSRTSGTRSISFSRAVRR
jgi:hypothetical protein